MIELVRLPAILAQRLAPRLNGPALVACWGLNLAAFVGAEYVGEHLVGGWTDAAIVGIVFLIPLFTLLVTLDWFQLRHAGPSALREGNIIPRLSAPARVLFGLLSVLALGGAGLEIAIPTPPQVFVAAGLVVIGAIAGWAALTGRVRSTVVRV